MTPIDANAGAVPATEPLAAVASSPPPTVTGRSGPRRWRAPLGPTLARPLAGGLLVAIVACVAWIVLEAAAGRSPLVPPQPIVAGYLSGIASRLSFDDFLIALLVMTACYAGVLALARRIPARWAIVAVVALHVVVLAGPIIISQDIFSYLAYGRLGVLHGIDPYSHGPSAAPHDAIYRFVGLQWRHRAAVYGPIFTLISYPLAGLGLVGGVWAMKVIATVASLATVALVWLCARRLGRDPVAATLLVGLNPILILYGLGGAHNELIMTAMAMAAVWWVLGGRDARGAAAVVAATAVKAPAGVLLPFMLLARRSLGVVVGAAAAVVGIGVVAYIAFGVHALDFVSGLSKQQFFVSTDSFPNEVAHTLGFPGVYPGDRKFLTLGLIIVLVYLAVRVWRGYDWISATALALVAIAVSSTWLLAWYTLWGLPLAAVARDRRVLVVLLAVQGLFLIHQLSPLLTP